MFFENFLAFCVKNGESPTSVVTKIGLNKSAVTSWRKGTNPTNTTLLKLANYFNISVEELTGKKEPAPINGDGLSEAKRRLWEAVDDLTDEQCEKLLGIVLEAKRLL